MTAPVQSFEGLGTFENAKSAEELAAALGRAAEVEPVEQTSTYPVTVFVTRDGVAAADGASVSFADAVSGETFNLSVSEPGTLTAEVPAGAYTTTVEDAFSDAPQTFSGLSVNPEGDNSFSFELANEVEVKLTVTPTDPVTGGKVRVSF